MLLAAVAPGVFAAHVQSVAIDRRVGIGQLVAAHRLLGHFLQADAFDTALSAVEVLVQERRRQADGVKDLGAAIGLIGGDAHLGHHLEDGLVHALDEALLNLMGRQLLGQGRAHGFQRFEGEVGIDRLGAVAGQAAHVMDLAGLAGLDDQADLGAQSLADQVVVHGRHGQQRRHRNAVGADLAVGQDQDVVALADAGLGIAAQGLDGLFHAFGARGGRPGDVERDRTEARTRHLFNAADLFQVLVGQDGLLDFKPLALGAVMHGQQVGARADQADQAHDRFLADRIDRRIGHLGEALLEVVEEVLGLVGQHRDRGVGAHGTDGLLAGHGDGLQQELEIFLGVAEDLLAVQQGVSVEALGFHLDLEVLQNQLGFIEPLLIGLLGGKLSLDLRVVDKSPLLQIDQKHLAGLQAPLLDDLVLGDRQHAHFRGQQQLVVLGDQVAGGAQAVAVERGADHAAVGEAHGGRAVPRLHQRGVVFVEGAAPIVHQRVAGPRLGHQHHHGMRQRIAAQHQKLERVVEAGGVALPLGDQREQLGQIVAQHRAAHGLATRVHPVDVTAQRVDLAVVADHAERMGQTPAWEGVGGEALVNQRQRRHHLRVGQVLVVHAHLIGQQHALVDQGARRQRGDVEVLVRAGRHAVLGLLADDEQLALERVLVGAVGTATDEDHADLGFGGLHRLAQARGIDGNVAPAQHDLPFGLHQSLDHAFAGGAQGGILGQEHGGGGPGAVFRQADADLGRLGAQEGLGQLDQDARAVAGQRIRTDGAAMGQVFEDFQTLLDDLVRLAVLDVGDEADAASVVFKLRVIKSLYLRQSAHLTLGSSGSRRGPLVLASDRCQNF